MILLQIFCLLHENHLTAIDGSGHGIVAVDGNKKGTIDHKQQYGGGIGCPQCLLISRINSCPLTTLHGSTTSTLLVLKEPVQDP